MRTKKNDVDFVLQNNERKRTNDKKGKALSHGGGEKVYQSPVSGGKAVERKGVGSIHIDTYVKIG